MLIELSSLETHPPCSVLLWSNDDQFEISTPPPPPLQGANPEHLTITLVSAKWGIWPFPGWGREYEPEVSVKFLNLFGRSGCTHMVRFDSCDIFYNEMEEFKGERMTCSPRTSRRDRRSSVAHQYHGKSGNAQGGGLPRGRCWSFEMIGAYSGSLFNETSLSKWKKYGQRCVKIVRQLLTLS